MAIQAIYLDGVPEGYLGTVEVEGVTKSPLNIVFEGNSLFRSFGGGGLIPYQVEQKIIDGGYLNTVVNVSGGGDTTTEMIEQYETEILPLFEEGKRNILIVWEYRNDIVKNDLLGSEAFMNMEAYLLLARQTPWEIWVMPMMPSWAIEYRGDFTEQGYINLGNERLIANQLLFDNPNLYDVLVDLRELPEVYNTGANEPEGWVFADGQPTTNTYFADGTHLKSAGKQLVSEFIFQKLLLTL